MHSDPSSFYGNCKARCHCSKRSLMSTVFCACKFSEKYCTWIVMVVNNTQMSRSSGKHDLRVTRWEEISSQKLAPKCDTRAHITLFLEPGLVRGNGGKFQSEKSCTLKKCRARTWEREPRWDFSRFSLAHAAKQRSIFSVGITFSRRPKEFRVSSFLRKCKGGTLTRPGIVRPPAH